jgi:hypothetical protein
LGDMKTKTVLTAKTQRTQRKAKWKFEEQVFCHSSCSLRSLRLCGEHPFFFR